MTPPRIALIHATRVAMAPIEAAFRTGWPEAETLSILDESLSADAASGRVPRDALDTRINRLADHARALDPDAILFTCSAFGTGIETAARRLDIPVLKPNEAMFDAAIAAGRRVAMLCSFAPSIAELSREFAAMAGPDAQLSATFVPGALDALKSGDAAAHNRLIAEAAVDIRDADALILAQFSMAQAAVAVRAVTPVPVLTSPETAVARLRARVETELEKGQQT